jgi:hypothetical protein
MISVILYGRNDSHGYNLHKRAAISLNCIAEVLTDPDDEILFVDCNTSNDLPTFIEAIYDTLTPEAKSRLRVFRVRPKLYARLVGQTHLFATEPHTRNIAIRRSNPRNRWLLTTNTDMIFVPCRGISSLTGAVRDLPDGQYVAPRFEVPEPLWESFPRSDPRACMRACEDLGPKLHLHEVAVRVPYMRFDSPGDFQLMPRQALFDIQGFDERMTHGWHADSNMCKRLCLFFGNRTESLSHRLRGYHCDHTRVATPLHQVDIKLENNLQEFVWNLEEPVAHHQAGIWGAPREPVEELDFTNGPPARFIHALERTLGGPQQADYPSDANDTRNFVFYPQEHALPYLAGNFTVCPPDTRFVYAGNNPRMLELTARCIAEMGFTEPLHYVAGLLSAGSGPPGAIPIRAADVPSGVSLAGHLLANYNPIIFDFGLDQNGLNLGEVARVTDWPRELRYSLGAVARCLEACAQASDAPQSGRGQIPDFLVLNANHYIFQRFIAQFMLSTETPYPVHVRKGRPRVGDERRYRGVVWKDNEELMSSFFAYDEEDQTLPTLAPGSTIDFTSAGRSARYKDGHWGELTYSGTWIDGHNAAIVFAPPDGFASDLVVYVRIKEVFLGPEEDPVRLRVYFEGELLTRWIAYSRFEVILCKAVLPGRLIAGKKACRLEFHAENPHPPGRVAQADNQQLTAEDPREWSVKIQRISFEGADRLRYALGDVLDFTENGQGGYYTSECWTQPDGYGTWTMGPDANIVLLLKEPVNTPLVATFTVTDVAVSPDSPLLDVQVAINGRVVAEWSLGTTRLNDERRIFLPEGLPSLDPVQISFHIKAPRSPKQLHWSTWDTRPLGFRLTKFSMSPAASWKYHLGDPIDLCDGGNSAAYVGEFLGTQWALPDQYGSWTVAREASLKVPFQEPHTTAMPATFVISDCMVSAKSPALAVHVKANGCPIADWNFTGREVHRRSVHLPAEVLAGSEELIFTFEIPTPRSPASLGWTSDSRELGIRLARAVIGRDDVEIPNFGRQPAARRGIVRRILGLPAFTVNVARLLAKRWSER